MCTSADAGAGSLGWTHRWCDDVDASPLPLYNWPWTHVFCLFVGMCARLIPMLIPWILPPPPRCSRVLESLPLQPWRRRCFWAATGGSPASRAHTRTVVALARSYAHTLLHTHSRPYAHTHSSTHTHALTHTHSSTHTHIHTHSHSHTQAADIILRLLLAPCPDSDGMWAHP